jgi:hypothetical protein
LDCLTIDPELREGKGAQGLTVRLEGGSGRRERDGTSREDKPTWRCRQNPFIGAVGIQEPVIPGEPLIKG